MFSDDDNNYFYWAPNQHFRMISEWSRDTEDWSKFRFANTIIITVLKYIKIGNII